MPRSIWSGSITYGMLSIPVKLYPATENKDIAFHLLHETCGSRVKQKRFCSTEDIELSAQDVVRSYEYAKDQYIPVMDADLAGLPVPAKNNIALTVVLDSSLLDPTYVEKTYWLGPDKLGLKPYNLLREALSARDYVAIASIAIRNKEVICALRPVGQVIMLHTLFWPDEIREREEPLDTTISEPEMDMAVMLIDTLHADGFDPDQFQDHYRSAVTAMIQSKLDGIPLTPAVEQPQPQTTDLMVALRAAVEQAKGESQETNRQVA